MRNWTGGLIGVMLLVLAQLAPAAAQQVPEHWAAAAPVFGATTSLSVSGSSSNTTLPATWPQYPAVVLTNDGSNELFWKLGTSNSVTAATTNAPLPAGYQVCVAINPGLIPSTQNTYIAAITSTSTSTLRVQAAGWCPVLSGGGSGGGGGGGGGAVYGPTAAGSPAANPPVLMGGTQNGAATGTVQNWEINSSGSGLIDTPSGGELATLLNAPVPGNASSNCSATASQSGTQPAQSDQYAVLCNDVWLWGGIVLGAATNFGTTPGAVKVPGVNASLFAGNTAVALGQALPSASLPVIAAFPTLAGGATLVKGTTAAMTGTSSTQIIAAVASNRIYVTRIKCNNSSATATLVQIQDGSGGTVLDTLAAGATYGGEQGVGTTPLYWTTSGNGLYAADVTTGASVICTASGYSG